MIVQFNDGETLTVQANFINTDGDGFFDFMKEIADNEKGEFVATVQCSNVKYITVENREE